MDKRAFLVLGPESSGTKLMAKLLVGSGCAGDGGHKQKFDTIDPAAPLIVYRRSYPHGGEWPDLTAINERFTGLGYRATAVVIVRSMRCTSASRGRDNSANDRRTQRAFMEIGSQLKESGLPFVWLTYEELVQRPGRTTAWLCGVLNLPLPKPRATIRDGNKKYE